MAKLLLLNDDEGRFVERAIVLFWPAAFFMKGDGAAAAEVARLKGEMQAIEQVNRIKNCGIQFAAI